MTNEEIFAHITAIAPSAKPGVNRQFPEAVVQPGDIAALARALKENPATAFDYLFCLTAADRKDGFNVVYHLSSATQRHCLVVRVVLSDKQSPEVDSVSGVWRAAEFYEREVFDLFGIRFRGHPDLRRVMLDDDWIGFPLRKDYKDSFMIDH